MEKMIDTRDNYTLGSATEMVAEYLLPAFEKNDNPNAIRIFGKPNLRYFKDLDSFLNKLEALLVSYNIAVDKTFLENDILVFYKKDADIVEIEKDLVVFKEQVETISEVAKEYYQAVINSFEEGRSVSPESTCLVISGYTNIDHGGAHRAIVFENAITRLVEANSPYFCVNIISHCFIVTTTKEELVEYSNFYINTITDLNAILSNLIMQVSEGDGVAYIKLPEIGTFPGVDILINELNNNIANMPYTMVYREDADVVFIARNDIVALSTKIDILGEIIASETYVNTEPAVIEKIPATEYIKE